MDKNLEFEKIKKENADLKARLALYKEALEKLNFSSAKWTGAELNEMMASMDTASFPAGAMPDTSKRDKTKYEYDGVTYSSKRELVQKCVRDIILAKDIKTEKSLYKAFPDELQGSFGVIKSEKEIDDKIKSGRKSYSKNRFLGYGSEKADKEAVIIAGEKYYICNEWHLDNIAKFIRYVTEEFGLDIKKLD